VLDGLEAERAGVPAAVVITDEFGPTARVALGNQGAGWFRFLEVSHPINILNEQQLAELAGGVAAQLVQVLTEPAQAARPAGGHAVGCRHGQSP
jgi:hypothetical protein